MINVTDISKLLNEETLYIDRLCKSSNINKWSFYKPVNSDSLSGLDSSGFYNLNDGFDVSSWKASTTIGIKNLIDSSVEWEYIDRQPPYRLGDFRNYDPSALRWFDIQASGITAGEVDDGQSFTLTWKNGQSYVPEIGRFKDSSVDSFGYAIWHSGNYYPANTTLYYNMGFIREYPNAGQWYQYNSNIIPVDGIATDQVWYISPCFAYTNRNGVPNRLYSYDDARTRGFTFLVPESNSIQFKVTSAAYRLFQNMEIHVYWYVGSISGNWKSFSGAVWIRNRNQEQVNAHLYIYNDNTDLSDPDNTLDTTMYDADVSIGASLDGTTWALKEILSGEMTNTGWDSTNSSDTATIWIDFSINGKHIQLAPTADHIPQTFIYNLGDYV